MRNKIKTNKNGELVKTINVWGQKVNGALVCSVTPDAPRQRNNNAKAYKKHIRELKEFARQYNPLAFQHLFVGPTPSMTFA